MISSVERLSKGGLKDRKDDLKGQIASWNGLHEQVNFKPIPLNGSTFPNKLGHPRPLFVFFYLFLAIYLQDKNFSRYRTQIIEEEGKNANHLITTTMAPILTTWFLRNFLKLKKVIGSMPRKKYLDNLNESKSPSNFCFHYDLLPANVE